MTAAKRLLSVAALLLLAAMLQGCPKQMAVTIINNSGSDLAIRLTDRDEPWPSSGAWSTDNKTDRLRWVEDAAAGGTVPMLDVVKGGIVTSYRLRVFPLPAEYLSDRGKPRAYLQMEGDGFLYAVRPGQRQPSQPQPPRFPLKPS